ncbi:hypothetical protein FKM82_001707 [Ascaphus truei]
MKPHREQQGLYRSWCLNRRLAFRKQSPKLGTERAAGQRDHLPCFFRETLVAQTELAVVQGHHSSVTEPCVRSRSGTQMSVQRWIRRQRDVHTLEGCRQ